MLSRVALFVVILVGAALLTVFGAQNTALADVRFMGWTVSQVPVFLLITSALILGVVATTIVSALGAVRQRLELRALEHRVRELEESAQRLETEAAALAAERDHLRRRLEEMERAPALPESTTPPAGAEAEEEAPPAPASEEDERAKRHWPWHSGD